MLVAILQSNLDSIIDFFGTIVATKRTVTDQRYIITAVKLISMCQSAVSNVMQVGVVAALTFTVGILDILFYNRYKRDEKTAN